MYILSMDKCAVHTASRFHLMGCSNKFPCLKMLANDISPLTFLKKKEKTRTTGLVMNVWSDLVRGLQRM